MLQPAFLKDRIQESTFIREVAAWLSDLCFQLEEDCSVGFVREEKMDVGSKNICRVCLSFDQNTRCILRGNPNHPDTVDTDLSEKLRLCGGVEVAEGDGLPATICSVCVSKLNDAHQLRAQCQTADRKLRELYGKARVEYNFTTSSTQIKDQSCQTDYFFTPDSSKPETGSPKSDEVSDSCDCMYSFLIDCVFNENVQEQKLEHKEIPNYCTSRNGCVKRKQAAYEKDTGGREVYRTQMTTVFKRVTSMESLKNDKERQRQYIKKNTAIKREMVEDEFPANMENVCRRIEGKSGSRLAYICQKCNRRYISKRSLDKHILSHDERQFTCDKCNKQFCQLDKLLRHTKLHKSKKNSKSVLCKICNKNFRKIDTMVRHLNAHKRVNPDEVLAICKEIREKRKLENCSENAEEEEGETTSDRNDKINPGGEVPITVHWQETPVEKQPVLEESKRNEWSSSFDSNVDTQQGRDDLPLYQCNHCSKWYRTEKSLQRHVLLHSEKKFFRQDRLKCQKGRCEHDEDKEQSDMQNPSDDTTANKLINSWIREELDSVNEEKRFSCGICGKSYDTEKSLLKHQVNVHDKQEGNCTNCSKVCDCRGKSKGQEKTSKKSKPYRCDECNKCFEKEAKLERHARIHERAKEQQDRNFKRFLCHICSKTFRQNTGLMFHMRTHTGYKPHVCKYCGRGFTSNSNRRNHERTHTGDRPFVCHFCSAAFAKSCTLKAHITTHTGEANYHCKICGKSFKRLKYLKEHSFTHTGEKPYACKICGTAYSHSGSLFVHEKKCKAQYTNYQPSNFVQPQINE